MSPAFPFYWCIHIHTYTHTHVQSFSANFKIISISSELYNNNKCKQISSAANLNQCNYFVYVHATGWENNFLIV